MGTNCNHSIFKKPIERQFESIDDEISADIEFILQNPAQPLYRSEHYGIKNHSIKILVPKIEYPGPSKLIKGTDHIRFLLSLYPDKHDLRSIDKLILRPRHIEAGGIELMALYIRSKKTLIHYLYSPHSYDFTDSPAAAYNEFLSFEVTRMINRNVHRMERESDMQIPSLLYVLSMLHPSGNEIDKFFFRSDLSGHDAVLSELDEISDFFAKNGY
jgi:hypothetical protein